MKKLLAALCIALMSLCLFSNTANAKDFVTFDENGNMIITEMDSSTAKWTYLWIAFPADYTGEKIVYLHSTNNPDGTNILSKDNCYLMDSYDSAEWNYECYRIKDLTPSEYWVSLESSFDEFSGKGFPDNNFRSLLPNINTKYTKIRIEADGDSGTPGARRYNIQQFFCVYSKTEELDANIENIESIFTDMMYKNVEHTANAYGTRNLVHNAFVIPIPGHYDDFVTLFQPFGCNLYDYFVRATESPMKDLLPEFCGNNNTLFGKHLTLDFDENYLREECSSNILYQGILFGWDFVLDTRNLTYDNPPMDHMCITDFCILEDGTLKNIFIKNLDDNIPSMKKVGAIDFNNKEDLLKFLGEEKLKADDKEYVIDGLDEVIDVDYGEESFNTVPEFEDTPDPVAPTPQTPTQTTPSWYKFVPLIVIGAIVLVIVVVFILSKKKKR